MRGHHGVQRGAPRTEALLLGLVSEEIFTITKKTLSFDSLSENESHELRHAVPMIVRRSESVLSHGPPGREDNKISNRCALETNTFFYIETVYSTLTGFDEGQVRTVNMEGSQWS